MGKFVGLIGTISGKVGNVVFVKGEKGISYGRTYQPNVLNPKTIGQTDQRAKMNLVGRISAITPKGLLSGLTGENNRQRRSRFNASLLNVATVDRSTPGAEAVAMIAPEDVIFSEGAIVPAANFTPGVLTADDVKVTLTLNDAADAGNYGERIIVAVIDPLDKGGFSFLKSDEVILENTTAVERTIKFGVELANESMVVVYRIPFRVNEAGRALYEGMANDGTNIIAKMVAEGSTYVEGFGRSVMAWSQVFTQA